MDRWPAGKGLHQNLLIAKRSALRRKRWCKRQGFHARNAAKIEASYGGHREGDSDRSFGLRLVTNQIV
jgi:hypothetical protein